MGVVKFNVGKQHTITATAGGGVAVTIGDKPYTQSSGSDVADTVSDFIVSYGKELNSLGILAVAGAGAASANLLLYGVPDARPVSSTFVNTEADNSAMYVGDSLTASNPSTANAVTYTLRQGSTTTATATTTYFDEASALADTGRVLHNFSLNADKVGSVKIGRASISTFA